MTITSSGPMCDVCGQYILPIDPEERVNTFNVRGIKQNLHCDNACKEKLLAAANDWTLLPEGPLRKAFEEANTQTVTVQRKSGKGRGNWGHAGRPGQVGGSR